MRILSVNPLHDSSAVLLYNGDIEFYYKEERLSRKKRDKMPFLSIIECAKKCNYNIDYILVNNTNNCFRSKCEYELYLFFLHKITKVPCENIVEFSDHHHLSHAGIAFFNSGFEESLVIVVDGEGSKFEDTVSECESVYLASYPVKFTPLIKNFYRNPAYHYSNEFNKNILDKLKSHFNCECNFNGNLGGIVQLYCTASQIISQSILENGKPMMLT